MLSKWDLKFKFKAISAQFNAALHLVYKLKTDSKLQLATRVTGINNKNIKRKNKHVMHISQWSVPQWLA